MHRIGAYAKTSACALVGSYLFLLPNGPHNSYPSNALLLRPARFAPSF